MTAMPKFEFTIATIAEAERRLGMKLGDIIAEIQSETGLALRTLRTLMAVGLRPAYSDGGSGWQCHIVDLDVALWFDQSVRTADRLLLQLGTAACAAAVGPDLGAFLLTLEGPKRG